MSVDLAGFNANEVPEQMDFAAVPPADYVAIATSSEKKVNKAGTGSYLQFVFDVLDGPFKGRKLWARLNLWSANQTAKDIAQRELGAFCRAVGVPTPNASSELHNKPLLLTVDVEKDDRGREGNVIKKYSAVNGVASAPAQQPQPAAYQTPTPTATPAAAPAAPAKAPWQ